MPEECQGDDQDMVDGLTGSSGAEGRLLPTKRRTRRPVAADDVRCTFVFRLYFDAGTKRWFFCEKGVGCCQHTGHCFKGADNVIQPTKNIGQDNMELSKQLLDAGTAIQSVIAFMHERTGQTLSADALKSMRQKGRDALLLSNGQNASLMSSADRLLHNLESDPDTCCVALLAEHDTALLSTPKVLAKHKRKESHSVEMELRSVEGDIHTVTCVQDVTLGNAEESPVTLANKIRQFW